MSAEQTVKDIGEFALINAIASRLTPPSAENTSVGIGDDSAIISARGGQAVACVDMLAQGVHFRLDWSSAHDVGRKAAAQNLADIYAMGAKPTALLVALALPADTPVSWVLDLADGLNEEAQSVGVSVVGGDIVRADSITISVTALGELGDRQPILRSGARSGDVIAVAGKLGYSAAGLLLLSRGFRSPRAVVNAHRVPEPAYALAEQASEATAMIDISDGLISDVGHIAKASGLQARIETDRIQVPADLQEVGGAFNEDPMQWILTGGEDHAFVATFKDALSVPKNWNIIGHMEEGPAQVLVDGLLTESGGWDHFSA